MIMAGVIPITKEGFDKLVAELEHLKKVQRPEVVRAISEARAQGDLSENAEYHAAKERQVYLEKKIGEIEARMQQIQVVNIDTTNLTTVIFGCTVKIIDMSDNYEEEYMLVGGDESDPTHGKISTDSPIGRALLGKAKGDIVEVAVPRGTMKLKIVDFSFKG